MNDVEVKLCIVLGFVVLCLLFMYIKLSEVSVLTDSLSNRYYICEGRLNSIDAGIQEMHKTEHEERIKEKMVKYVRQGGFAANVEDTVDYLYKVAHEEDKND